MALVQFSRCYEFASAGASGHGLPLRNLYVSPDHAMLVEGCLVHASALVNGRTILRMTQWQGNVEYYHIETENHELILAEAAATETFVDNVSREKFDNHAEFAALYPSAALMVELDLPRVCFQRQLPRAIARRKLRFTLWPIDVNHERHLVAAFCRVSSLDTLICPDTTNRVDGGYTIFASKTIRLRPSAFAW